MPAPKATRHAEGVGRDGELIDRREGHAAPRPSRRLSDGADEREIGVHHHGHQFGERHGRFPAQFDTGLAGVAHQEVDLGRTDEALVDDTCSAQSRPTWLKASSQSSRTEWVSPVATT
jgi:hypothetical protein